LTFAEVSRALRALSATYVERRAKLSTGAALAGAGKRAAFALFYGPIHYLLIERIIHELAATASPRPDVIVDLGSGTGVAGAAFARAYEQPPKIAAFDIHPWSLDETARTHRAFGLAGRTHRADVTTAALPRGRAAIVAAYSVNEISDQTARDRLLERILDRAAAGGQTLIVEPLARSVSPWWADWQERFVRAGGRVDAWRFPSDLPPIVAKLDRAAGLDHSELTGRSLWLSAAGAPTP
jgi:hypothetical protein